MIGITVTAALLCWGAVLAMLRAAAQDAAPEPAAARSDAPPPTAGDSNEAEEIQRRSAPPKSAVDEPAEYRDSADNNIRLPIDI